MPTENEIAILKAARADGVTSRNELSNLMAQLGHESGGFVRLEEGFRYSSGNHRIPVKWARREGADALDAARIAALEGRPQELARLMYGNRMGNDDAGDGYRYRGRGFIQLTGEDNYRAAGRALGLDLPGQPELAAERDNAARIALWYWRERVPAADRDDVSAAARRINGGETGLADRHDRFDAWHRLLTPTYLADLDAGRIQPGTGVGPRAGRNAIDDGALRRFETGSEVVRLQGDLTRLGVADDRGRAIVETSRFDAATEQAVRRFQERAQLDVTGRADPETLQALQHAVNKRKPENDLPAAHGRQEIGDGQKPGEREARPASGASSRLSPSDRDLLSSIRDCVSRLDAAHRRDFDDSSERACWALLPLAKSAGMTRAEHAVVSVRGPGMEEGQNIFVVQGRLDDPAHVRVCARTSDAIRCTVEESAAHLDIVNLQIADQALQRGRCMSQDEVERLPAVQRLV